jgi:hypothetical protein
MARLSVPAAPSARSRQRPLAYNTKPTSPAFPPAGTAGIHARTAAEWRTRCLALRKATRPALGRIVVAETLRGEVENHADGMNLDADHPAVETFSKFVDGIRGTRERLGGDPPPREVPVQRVEIVEPEPIPGRPRLPLPLRTDSGIAYLDGKRMA